MLFVTLHKLFSKPHPPLRLPCVKSPVGRTPTLASLVYRGPSAEAQPLPPLCKGRWHGEAGPEGLPPPPHLPPLVYRVPSAKPHPSPPLCKGRWHGVAVTEGLPPPHLPPLCKGRWHGVAVTEGLPCEVKQLVCDKKPLLECSGQSPSRLRRQPPLHKGAKAWVVSGLRHFPDGAETWVLACGTLWCS